MSFFRCIRPKKKEPVPIIPERALVNWDNAFINCQQDYALVEELFSYLVPGLEESMVAITTGYETKDYKKVSDTAHRIKGDSASLACDDLSFHAHELQIHPEKRVNVDNLLKSANKTIECVNKRYP